MMHNPVITDARISDYHAYNGSTQKELILSFEPAAPVSEPLFYHIKDQFFLLMDQNCAKLHIHIYQGDLRYYYTDYSNYYYLPEEDVAMHKSVAAYVDKSHRRQATASTAYLRETGIFLPQLTERIKPAYRQNYRDTISYFELSQNFCSSQNALNEYAADILQGFSK